MKLLKSKNLDIRYSDIQQAVRPLVVCQDGIVKESKNMALELKFNIISEIAILSERTNGWSKQLNLVSWNDGEPKYDIRDWAPNRKRIGKGVTLTAAELQCLFDAIQELEL